MEIVMNVGNNLPGDKCKDLPVKVGNTEVGKVISYDEKTGDAVVKVYPKYEKKMKILIS